MVKEKLKKEILTREKQGTMLLIISLVVGAMAIVGSIEEGISGDYSILIAKSILDCIIILIMAAGAGVGTMFSAIPLFIYQGTITLIAKFLGSFASAFLISNLSLVGSALILCIGINIPFGKKIRVGNFLPAMLIPILYSVIF